MMRKKITQIISIILLCMGLVACGSASGAEYTRGIALANMYTNESLGLKATYDSDWSVLSDKEIEELVGLTLDRFEGNVKKFIENGGVMLDFQATNTKTGATINIGVQKLDAIGNIAVASLSEQQYLEGVYESMKEYGQDKQFFIANNITGGKIEIGETTFCGEKVPCFVITGNIQQGSVSMPVYERQVYRRGKGVVAVITSASFNTDTTEENLAMFE